MLLTLGCGSGGGGGEPFEPGPYTGTSTFRSDNGNVGNCLALVTAALGRDYRLYITEQFFADETSQLVIEHELDSGALVMLDPGATSASFTERASGTGVYGSSTVTCDGTASTALTSEANREIQVDSELNLTCRISENPAAPVNCVVREEATLQG